MSITVRIYCDETIEIDGYDLEHQSIEEYIMELDTSDIEIQWEIQ